MPSPMFPPETKRADEQRGEGVFSGLVTRVTRGHEENRSLAKLIGWLAQIGVDVLKWNILPKTRGKIYMRV